VPVIHKYSGINKMNQQYFLRHKNYISILFYRTQPVGCIIQQKGRWVSKIKNCADATTLCGRHSDRNAATARLWECRFDAWHSGTESY